jgi:Fe-S-cluster containining protein
MKNYPGPCLEKQCTWCCNPVKVPKDFPDKEMPVDKGGNQIWHECGEIIAPENHIETVKIKTFDCVNLDAKTGKCRDYENRPEICRNTSYIQPDSTESTDTQHRKMTSEKFIILNQTNRKK